MIGRGLLAAAGLIGALLLLAHLVGTDGPAFVVGFAALDLLALYLGLAIAAGSPRDRRGIAAPLAVSWRRHRFVASDSDPTRCLVCGLTRDDCEQARRRDR